MWTAEDNMMHMCAIIFSPCLVNGIHIHMIKLTRALPQALTFVEGKDSLLCPAIVHEAALMTSFKLKKWYQQLFTFHEVSQRKRKVPWILWLTVCSYGTTTMHTDLYSRCMVIHSRDRKCRLESIYCAVLSRQSQWLVFQIMRQWRWLGVTPSTDTLFTHSLRVWTSWLSSCTCCMSGGFTIT